jgi:hypothetical protein
MKKPFYLTAIQLIVPIGHLYMSGILILLQKEQKIRFLKSVEHQRELKELGQAKLDNQSSR